MAYSVGEERGQVEGVEDAVREPDVLAEGLPFLHDHLMQEALHELVEEHLLCAQFRVEAPNELEHLAALAACRIDAIEIDLVLRHWPPFPQDPHLTAENMLEHAMIAELARLLQ